MAAKTFTSICPTYQYLQLKLDISAAPNIAENKSTIQFVLYLYKPTNEGWYTYPNQNACIFTLNGHDYVRGDVGAIDLTGQPAGSYHVISSGSFEVSHNNDGTKSIPVYAAFDQQANSQIAFLIDDTFTLDTISRASKHTTSDQTVYLGNAVTLYTNRVVDSYTHKFYYQFKGTRGEIDSNVETTTIWTPPASLASYLPNETSASCDIICMTYNGTRVIGSNTTQIVLKIPDTDDFRPSASTTIDKIFDNDIDIDVYVQNKTKLDITVVPVMKYNATLKSAIISVNGTKHWITPAESLNLTTGVLTKAGTNNIVVTLQDSRGRSYTNTIEFEVKEYSSPTISTLTASRVNDRGIADDSGAYIKAVFSATITSLDELNTHSFSLKYKKTTDDTWTDITSSLFSGYSFNGNQRFAADTNSSYQILLTAEDLFSSVSKTVPVSSAYTLIDFHESGRGIGIGKVSETEELVDSAFDIAIKGKKIFDVMKSIEILPETEVSQTELDVTLEESIYGYQAICLTYKAGLYTNTVTIPLVRYSTNNILIPLFFSTQMHAILRVKFITGTTLKVQVITIEGVLFKITDYTKHYLSIDGINNV